VNSAGSFPSANLSSVQSGAEDVDVPTGKAASGGLEEHALTSDEDAGVLDEETGGRVLEDVSAKTGLQGCLGQRNPTKFS
jgi:hypothetical protein